MGYKMIVLDLDDTLLKKDGTISTKTKETLKNVQKNGIKVVLASGRPTFAIESIAEELELRLFGGYIVSYNGARIIDCASQQEIYASNITKANVYELYNLSKDYGAFIQTYIDDKIIASEPNEYTEIEKQITGMDIIIPNDFKAYVQNDVVKVIVLQHPDKLEQIEKAWKSRIADRMYMTISKPFFLEFMNPDVDKSKSILRLADILSISDKEIIAIGDSYNDISMIKAAGLGVAMKNAVASVKEIADYITDDNEHDGVAKVLDMFIEAVKTKTA